MSNAANVHKGHDEACTGKEARKAFQWWLSCGPSTRCKRPFPLTKRGGILGGIDIREYLITSSGWFSASVKAAEPLLNAEAEKMPCNKVEKNEAGSSGSCQVLDWEEEGESVWCILWRIFRIPLTKSSWELVFLSGMIGTTLTLFRFWSLSGCAER